MEKIEEPLRIQREGMAQAQRLQNESANLSAFQFEKQAEVGVEGAKVFGQIGANGAGNLNLGGGLGMNPAGMLAGITSALTLAGIFGISTKGRTGGINIQALSSIFFVLFLICNLVFAFTAVKLALYVIINGILLLIYAVSTYGIIKSRQ
ncbi:hypothetical protein [Treponema sp.]|uniref:hypothetical protein n=1 Tax=Treponema sp. TaxID=166 RepID=UPI0025DF2029|nr:hypothetical protein [Treponema sp.]MCR5219283.1 hypothetical protein [Treponema sp.]